MESWKNIAIEKIVLKTKLKDPTKEPNKHFYYVDVSSVSNDLLRIETPNILFGKDAPSRARKLIHYEDTIFATVRPTLKRIAFVPKELDGQICSTGYCVLKADKKQVESLFLYFSLLPDFFMDRIAKLQRGASYPAIRDSDLKSQNILLPPLPEQRKIAYILSTIQKAIAQQDKLIRTTTELKKALMQKLFTEGTKGERQKQTEIGLVPEIWDVVNLGVHSKIITSFPTFVKVKSKYSDKPRKFKIHYLKVSDMNLKGNEICFLASNNTFYTNDKNDFNTGFIKPDSLIFPKRGAAIATNKKRITTKYSILDPNLIGVEPFEELNFKFLYYFFETFDLKNLQDNNVIPQLNKHNVAGVKMPLPNILEQISIVKSIDSISQKIIILKSKKQTLTDLFKSFLHELMTGQRRVHEINFEKQLKEITGHA
jgi:type I restriction enzyme, S subunit